MSRIYPFLLLLTACGNPQPPGPTSDTACEGACPCDGVACPFECVTPECQPACNSAELCEVACNGANLCEVDCNSVDTCKVYCEDAANCDVRCNSVESCEVECPIPGQCTLDCNSSNCSCTGPGCP